MRKNAYSRLMDSLNLRGGSVMPIDCKEFHDLIEELFDPEEALLFAAMPLGPAPADRIAKEAERNPDETEVLLERMADKGLIMYKHKGGEKTYATLPLVPGIFEFQFLKGESGQRDKRLAALFEAFFEVMRNLPPSDTKVPSFPFARIVPVEEEIPANTRIFPFEQVSEYINTAEYISVSTCYCRHHGDLIGHGCNKPKDVCLSLGPSAKFIIEKGFGRLVSREEAKGILQLSEDAGLVHIVSNTSKYIDFICNCCVCHCGILKSVKNLQTNYGISSNYIVAVDQESCQGCKLCIERCPVEAFSMNDDVAERDPEKCIGCGLCVSTCPSESLEMVLRSDRRTPPSNNSELMASIVASLE
jgi:electron transport complex protein RnfB